MASSDNEAIAGNSTEGEVEVKLVAKFLVSILSLAVRNFSTVMNPTNLCASWAFQPSV